jgi:hypothetical protein
MRDLPLSKRPERAILDNQPPGIGGMPVKMFLGIAMDVTEQEQLTQELQRREAYLAEAQRLSHTGSFGLET